MEDKGKKSRRFGSIPGFIIRTMSNVERARIIDKYWNNNFSIKTTRKTQPDWEGNSDAIDSQRGDGFVYTDHKTCKVTTHSKIQQRDSRTGNFHLFFREPNMDLQW